MNPATRPKSQRAMAPSKRCAPKVGVRTSRTPAKVHACRRSFTATPNRTQGRHDGLAGPPRTKFQGMTDQARCRVWTRV